MVASRPFDLWRLEPRFRVASPLRSSSVAADEFIKRMLMSCLCLALTRRRRGTAVAAADDDDQDLGRRRRNIFPPKRRPMKNGRKKKQTERTEGNTSHCVGRHGYWLGGSCGAFNLQMALSDSGAFGFNWNRLRARRKVKGGGGSTRNYSPRMMMIEVGCGGSLATAKSLPLFFLKKKETSKIQTNTRWALSKTG